MRLRSGLEYGRWLVSGRTQPLSRHWGFDRGTPVDRWYIERWLAGQARDIRGSVLEVKDSGYTTRFGAGVTAVPCPRHRFFESRSDPRRRPGASGGVSRGGVRLRRADPDPAVRVRPICRCRLDPSRLAAGRCLPRHGSADQPPRRGRSARERVLADDRRPPARASSASVSVARTFRSRNAETFVPPRPFSSASPLRSCPSRSLQRRIRTSRFSRRSGPCEKS